MGKGPGGKKGRKTSTKEESSFVPQFHVKTGQSSLYSEQAKGENPSKRGSSSLDEPRHQLSGQDFLRQSTTQLMQKQVWLPKQLKNATTMYIKQGKMPIEQEQLEILFQVIIGTLVFPVKIEPRLGYKMADHGDRGTSCHLIWLYHVTIDKSTT